MLDDEFVLGYAQWDISLRIGVRVALILSAKDSLGEKRGLLGLLSEKKTNASACVRQYSLPYLQALQIVHNVRLRWS